MILSLLVLSMWQPLDLQKTSSAERLIFTMGAKVTHPEHHQMFRDAECQILDRGIEIGFVLPGQLPIGGKTTSFLCSFDTSCGTRTKRHIFHTGLYGAWKPADSFAWTVGVACPEMLTRDAFERLPQHFKDAQ
ncbi:hypothetical protein [uncultured Tateyamaria sp.]|uniref:hypothetical protein n=1 Tax=uncultured Tateyamaria sp. TaxID=455651 RepID=UPI0026337518|nr:hypothetical protein [uncultured Tateyamaria sp.]